MLGVVVLELGLGRVMRVNVLANSFPQSVACSVLRRKVLHAALRASGEYATYVP